MPSVAPDQVSILDLQEDRGVIKSMTRKMRVYFDLTVESIPNDPTVLVTALNAAGVPLPFSLLSISGCESLVLVKRDVGLVDQDIGTVDVLCKYEHILDGANQVLDAEPNSGVAGSTGTIYGKGKCSITQKPTNFYYPNGISSNTIPNPAYDPSTEIGALQPETITVSLPQTRILVAHTYSNPLLSGSKIGTTEIRGGEVQLPFPQANYQMEGIFNNIVDPWEMAGDLIGTINEETWASKPPTQWLCSEVSFELLSIAQHTYRYKFEWQHNPDGWNPTVIFIDDRTQRPPADVEEATTTLPITQAMLNAGFPNGVGGSNVFILDGVTGPFKITNPISVANIASIVASFPGAGVGSLSPALNDGSYPYLPAGVWTVPALRQVDYNQYFGQFFEGLGSIPQ
jgi:hypothetical protein